MEANNQNWEIIEKEKKNLPTWVILMRKPVQANVLEYKIVGGINSSSKGCISSFRQDINYQANKSSNKKFSTYEIVRESKSSLLTYVIHNSFSPLKDIEMSLKYVFFTKKDGGLGVRWNEAWDEYPIQPSKNLNRIEIFRGSWDFTGITNIRCMAVNSIQFDTEQMPLWLVRRTVIKYLVEGLENIREITS